MESCILAGLHRLVIKLVHMRGTGFVQEESMKQWSLESDSRRKKCNTCSRTSEQLKIKIKLVMRPVFKFCLFKTKIEKKL